MNCSPNKHIEHTPPIAKLRLLLVLKETLEYQLWVNYENDKAAMLISWKTVNDSKEMLEGLRELLTTSCLVVRTTR